MRLRRLEWSVHDSRDRRDRFAQSLQALAHVVSRHVSRTAAAAPHGVVIGDCAQVGMPSPRAAVCASLAHGPLP
jgi:hypothetical protein